MGHVMIHPMDCYFLTGKLKPEQPSPFSGEDTDGFRRRYFPLSETDPLRMVEGSLMTRKNHPIPSIFLHSLKKAPVEWGKSQEDGHLLSFVWGFDGENDRNIVTFRFFLFFDRDLQRDFQCDTSLAFQQRCKPWPISVVFCMLCVSISEGT